MSHLNTAYNIGAARAVEAFNKEANVLAKRLLAGGAVGAAGGAMAGGEGNRLTGALAGGALGAAGGAVGGRMMQTRAQGALRGEIASAKSVGKALGAGPEARSAIAQGAQAGRKYINTSAFPTLGGMNRAVSPVA